MRKKNATGGLLVLVVALVTWQWNCSVGEGCKTVSRDGAYVEIAEESAIIIWDEANKTEHFIRWLSFAAQTPDFGFLVPTPTVPILAEASVTAFDFMNELIKPEVVNTMKISLFCMPGCSKRYEEK